MTGLRGIAVAALVTFAAVASVAPARAQITLNEANFSARQLTGDFSKQIELGIGPDSCLYYGSFDGLTRYCPPPSAPAGLLGSTATNTTTVCDPALTFPVGIAFSSGGSFGNYMYVADYGVGDIHRAAGCTTSTTFATLAAPGAIAFPPNGSAYGDFLYACAAFSGPIYRVSSTGVLTSWSTLATTYLKFGPGGAWGTGLYATAYGGAVAAGIAKVSSTGAASSFSGTGFFTPEGFDWGFDGDLFATDVTLGQVFRVKSDGSKTLFASLAGAADVAYRPSEDALYVVSNQGGLYRVQRGATAGVDPASLRDAPAIVAPNPARGACALSFTQRAAGTTRVSVIDAQGRLVRRLPDTWRPAGAQLARWDGRDDTGAAVHAGAYFMRLWADGRMQTARVTIAR